MNDDPSMKVALGDKEFSAKRDNAFLYTFLGDLGIHDHIFLVINPETSEGTFIFKTMYPEAFDDMGTYMVENSYVAHLNAPEVSQCDADAFNRALMGDLGDTIPEGWV